MIKFSKPIGEPRKEERIIKVININNNKFYPQVAHSLVNFSSNTKQKYSTNKNETPCNIFYWQKIVPHAR